MTSIRMHPSELAYAFSYSNTVDVVGWGRDPFLPTTSDTDGDPKDWYADGAARLAAAGRLTGTPDKDLNFTDEVASAVLALADPALVLLAERKEGNGLRRLTVHVAKDTVIGMSRSPDGMFELTRYADLTAATIACAGFLGLARSPAQAGTRIDTTQEALKGVHQLASTGQADQATANLVKLGATEQDADSIRRAMVEPVSSGVLSVLYCAGNAVRKARPYSVMTNADDETWILFLPASLEGPMVIERSSVSALTARVLVEVAASLKITD